MPQNLNVNDNCKTVKHYIPGVSAGCMAALLSPQDFK